MILGLRTVIYPVPNLEEAKEWYTKAFEKSPYFDEPFYVGFSIGGYELGLLPETAEASSKKTPPMTYWGVEDIHKEYNRLLSLGASMEEEPNSVGGPILVASVRDPWNNLIGLIFNPVFAITP